MASVKATSSYIAERKRAKERVIESSLQRLFPGHFEERGDGKFSADDFDMYTNCSVLCLVREVDPIHRDREIDREKRDREKRETKNLHR